MRIVSVAVACAVVMLCNVHASHADDSAKRAMGLMYEMWIIPKVCGWKDAASAAKLDAKIAEQEKALGIFAADRADLIKRAEAEIKSDPGNCMDGTLRALYDEVVE